MLGWSEVAPVYQVPREPQRSDFIIDVKKFIQLPEYRKVKNQHDLFHPWQIYKNNFTHYIYGHQSYFITYISGKKGNIMVLDVDEINSYASTIKSEHERVFKDLQNLFSSITVSYNDDLKNQIIETIQHLNQVASDLEFVNNDIINRKRKKFYTDTYKAGYYIVNDDDPIQRRPIDNLFMTVFLKHFGITKEQLPTFIIPGFDSEELKKSVCDLIDEHFKRICETIHGQN